MELQLIVKMLKPVHGGNETNKTSAILNICLESTSTSSEKIFAPCASFASATARMRLNTTAETEIQIYTFSMAMYDILYKREYMKAGKMKKSKVFITFTVSKRCDL